MRLFTLSALALSIGTWCTTAQADTQSQDFVPFSLKSASEQEQASGFIDGQSLSGSTRNWYARERATRAPLWKYYKSDGTRHDTHSRDNWVQGTILNYSSGFTQGTVASPWRLPAITPSPWSKAARPSPGRTTAP